MENEAVQAAIQNIPMKDKIVITVLSGLSALAVGMIVEKGYLSAVSAFRNRNSNTES